MKRAFWVLVCACLLGGCVSGDELVAGGTSDGTAEGALEAPADGIPSQLSSACDEWGISDSEITSLIAEMRRNKASGLTATEQYVLLADEYCDSSTDTVPCVGCLTSMVVYVYNEQ
ncbi:MAG: hypothetical protein JXO22_03130 [Phycisphaerae bacterium]|nr:hypothetical protein [Phycisphaerae bacterium]